MFFPSWNFFVHKEINSKLFFQKFKQVFPLEARSLALDHFHLKFHIAIQTLYIKIILCSHLTLKSFIWSPSQVASVWDCKTYPNKNKTNHLIWKYILSKHKFEKVQQNIIKWISPIHLFSKCINAMNFFFYNNNVYCTTNIWRNKKIKIQKKIIQTHLLTVSSKTVRLSTKTKLKKL